VGKHGLSSWSHERHDSTKGHWVTNFYYLLIKLDHGLAAKKQDKCVTLSTEQSYVRRSTVKKRFGLLLGTQLQIVYVDVYNVDPTLQFSKRGKKRERLKTAVRKEKDFTISR